METKKQFLKAAKREYKRAKAAEKHAEELTKQIQRVRDLGFKVIVLGKSVKVT